jgi:PPM family protein phosphatase
VDDQRIEAVLAANEPEAAARTLTQHALSAGGKDNVTCVVVDVVDGPRVVGDGKLLGAVGDPRNIVDATAVRLG